MTNALILAAGQGTRLRPLTDHTPKCLVKLMGRPLLLRQVDVLKACGVTNISVATGYEGQQISALGLQTYLNPQYMTTNMVESLFMSREGFPEDQDLIIAYGDIVYNEANLKALLASTAPLSVVVDLDWRDLWSLRMSDPLSDAETLKLDDNGNIKELGQKPDSYDDIEGQYIGLIKVSASFLKEFIAFYDSLDKEATYDGRAFEQMYMTSFIQMFIDKGVQVSPVLIKKGWLEVDSCEDLDAYVALNEKNELNRFIEL